MQSYGLDARRVVNVFYVQKGFIITVFSVIFGLAVYLSVSLPDIYKSSTLILITPQKLPPSYVNSTVTTSLDQRIRSITEGIFSRTRLERIVEEFNLYPLLGRMDGRVERLRKSIQIDARRTDAFALSYEHRSPEKAMQVTSRLGGLFIDENLQMREQQATGTTIFINAEADRLRKELEEQEQEVNLYKAQHRFELPEQLEANLRTLEQVRAELQGNMLRLTSLQERKGNLEKQLVETKFVVTQGQGVSGGWQTLEDRKAELEDLRTRYSDRHPDVLRLKSQIQLLEAEEKNHVARAKGLPATEVPVPQNPLQQTLFRQISELNLEINALRSRNEILRNQIASYQARVDNTPVRAIELSKISRVYDITLKKYNDLQGKALDSQLSENMEKKQKGEQFQVTDRANLPQQPVAPDRLRIVLVGLVLALTAGFGLAFMRENLDTSFNRGEELREHISLPLLATLPAIITRGSILEHRRSQMKLLLASVTVFVVGAVSIHLYGSLFY
jgi:polysaccharide chain length determinant protein (PEP-CTERM system associated)